MIIGIKLWYADGSKYVVAMKDRSRDEVQAQLAQLPSSGLQVTMVYFDEHSTVTCPSGHNHPFTATVPNGVLNRVCPKCRARITDQGIRYRRVVQGNDHYFVMYDDVPPPPLQDWLIGQTDKPIDLDKYPGARLIDGGFVTDTAYKAYVNDAMNDYDVSAFGMSPEPGTTDR